MSKAPQPAPVYLNQEGSILFYRSSVFENSQSPASIAEYGEFRITSYAQMMELMEKAGEAVQEHKFRAELAADLIKQSNKRLAHLVNPEDTILDAASWMLYIIMLRFEITAYDNLPVTTELISALKGSVLF